MQRKNPVIIEQPKISPKGTGRDERRMDPRSNTAERQNHNPRNPHRREDASRSSPPNQRRQDTTEDSQRSSHPSQTARRSDRDDSDSRHRQDQDRGNLRNSPAIPSRTPPNQRTTFPERNISERSLSSSNGRNTPDVPGRSQANLSSSMNSLKLKEGRPTSRNDVKEDKEKKSWFKF